MQDTNDHDELQLLHSLNKMFVADCRTGGELLVGRACVREAEVHFILDSTAAARPVVLGYVATVRSYKHDIPVNVPDLPEKMAHCGRRAGERVPLLAQLFV